MNIYADSSFFVAHYLQDRHSPEVARRMALKPGVWLTPFQAVELVHAIQQYVFRGTITSYEADLVTEAFEQDRAHGIWILTEQPKETFVTCERLARRHVARLGVRTLDSLHVAAALELQADNFWTFDQRQARLAEAEGLTTI
ncbi:type II toxin-antitoxin system VapC family toxin [Acidicapsa acidisoli]|uniref:type II toxin-antitoxin system VapC family toxin n=1 Tax=Acidicapsa acidisoli TaxID=1615681 RepID=UPI0021E0C622|nr:type II toxin-antitoxin system VapC family toxin [Acidicapsa acidisoli]